MNKHKDWRSTEEKLGITYTRSVEFDASFMKEIDYLID